MKRLGFMIMVMTLVALMAGTAWAGDGGEQGKTVKVPRAWAPMGTCSGPGGQGVPPGLFGVGGNFLYGDSDGVRKGSDHLSDATKVDKFMEVIKLRYGIMPDMDVRVAFPIYNLNFDMAANDKTYSGNGDTTVVFRNVLWNQDKGDPFFFAIDYGPILPTASIDKDTAIGAGPCAWGGVLGIGATYFSGASRFDGELNFATFAEGAREYEKGNRARLNLSYAYALSSSWDVGAEASYEWNAEAEQYDKALQNESSELYVGPKIVWKTPWKMNIGLSAQLPAYRWYQGTKAGSDDYRVLVKLVKFYNIGTFFD